MSRTDHYAVFGHPIKHSKSPSIHQLFAKQTQQHLIYTAHEVKQESFYSAVVDFFDQGGKGLNCTIPLKKLAWQRAELLSKRAQLSKAVNTLYLQKDGVLFGDNTDGVGLITDLIKNHAIALLNSRILILGAGGASSGIIAPLLNESPAYIIIANRTVDKAKTLSNEFSKEGEISGCGYNDLKKSQFDLIINATSTSLYGKLPPLPELLLAKSGCCYDLAYGNLPTVFVNWGIKQDAKKSLDGLGMLVEQAAEAFFVWRGVRPKTEDIIKQLSAERNKLVG